MSYSFTSLSPAAVIHPSRLKRGEMLLSNGIMEYLSPGLVYWVGLSRVCRVCSNNLGAGLSPWCPVVYPFHSFIPLLSATSLLSLTTALQIPFHANGSSHAAAISMSNGLQRHSIEELKNRYISRLKENLPQQIKWVE